MITVPPNDEARPIPGYPGYVATRDGRVRGTRGWWLKSGHTSKNGRADCLFVYPHINGKRRSLTVQRAVLLAWVGPCPEGMEANHVDGNALNNHLDNLRWERYGVAERRSASRRTPPRGEQIARAKLTEADVHEIRRHIAEGKLNAIEIGALFGVSNSTVSQIRSGRAWGWLA